MSRMFQGILVLAIAAAGHDQKAKDGKENRMSSLQPAWLIKRNRFCQNRLLADEMPKQGQVPRHHAATILCTTSRLGCCG